jgi:hypothetical protein
MKTTYRSITDRVFAWRQSLLQKVPFKVIFILTGLLSTIWFLMRVIPKPSRAGYPCMQAAAPIMSGFVLYLLSFTGSFFAFRKAQSLANKKNYLTASALIAVGLIFGAVFFVTTNTKNDARANITIMNEPPDGANNPMGVGKGIFPGRVIWAWNPDATNSNTKNLPGDAFWDFKNNDTLIIRGMVEQSILKLTGTEEFSAAWDSIFTNHNRNKKNESVGYTAGETIFIKINQGTSRWVLNSTEKANGYAWQTSGTIEPAWRRKNFAATETGPFVVLNLLRQLINEAGVPQENIYVGDPMSHTFKHNFQVWYDEFPNVKYTDKHSGSESHKRTRIYSANDESMEYSDDGEVMKDGIVESYFDKMIEADYMINVACLKPHKNAGVSFGAKNHFGSITRSGAGHLHPSLIGAVENGVPTNEGYDKYRVAVDIMGHKNLGANTMLLVIEGLFGGSEDEVWGPVKYYMDPFNGDWSNSIFMSLDQVAIESVAYDFLRAEFDGVRNPGLTDIYPDWPNWLGADAYLHHASDPSTWPTGIVYNPDGRGPINSLGVHEHWNNPIDKQYSRNLGTGEGIELIKTDGTASDPNVSVAELRENNQLQLSTYPNPFRDEMTISFNLREPGKVVLQVFDMQGRNVADMGSRQYFEGVHEIRWSAADHNLSPGFYMVRMQLESGNNKFLQSYKIQLIN